MSWPVETAEPGQGAAATATPPGPPARVGGRTRRRGPRNDIGRSQRKWGFIFVAPAVLGFAIFTIGPMLASFGISLTDWSIGGQANFVGVENYRALLDDTLFWQSLKATGLYTVMAVPASLVTAFFAAMLLQRANRFSGVFRTLFYLPVLVPPVASSMLWMWIFNPDLGLANGLLELVGLPGSRWIYSETTVMPSLAIMSAWSFGNTALIFLAGLKGVPRELYEAAEVDGAGAVRRLWHVTLPQLSPIILFNLVMGVIGALQVFDVAYVMTNGGPNNATFFYVFYLYTRAFGQGQFGYASALAWVLFVVVLIVTALLFRSARSWVFYGGARR